MKRKYSLIIFLLLSTCLLSITTGQSSLNIDSIYKILQGHGTAKETLILYQFRLPRMILAFLVGAALALAGMLLQTISRNPLADSGILGINAGAGLTMMLFLLLQGQTISVHTYVQPFYALLGGLIVVFLIFLLSYHKHYGIIPLRLLYTGIAISSAISALMIILTYVLEPQQYQMIKVWLAGSLNNSNWHHVFALLPWIVIIVPILYRRHLLLDTLQLSDETAIGIGASIFKIRLFFLVCTVLLVSPAVAVSGSIGFVGLIVPHLVRQLFGVRHKFIILANILVGGGLVILADGIGKMIVNNTEIPAGVIVAIIGAPYFIYLLITNK